MSKKEEKEPEVDPKDKKSDPEPEKKLEAKIDDAKAKGVPAAAINPIGDIPKPEGDAPKGEWKEYFEKVDAKLDQLIAACVKKEEPKKGFWDFE